MSAVTRLSDQDIYALARAFVGLSWGTVPVSPVAELLLTHLDLNKPDEMQIMRRVLGPDALHAVLAVDPNGPAPVSRLRTG